MSVTSLLSLGSFNHDLFVAHAATTVAKVRSIDFARQLRTAALIRRSCTGDPSNISPPTAPVPRPSFVSLGISLTAVSRRLVEQDECQWVTGLRHRIASQRPPATSPKPMRLLRQCPAFSSQAATLGGSENAITLWLDAHGGGSVAAGTARTKWHHQ